MSVLPFRSSAEIAAALPTVVRHLASGGLIGYPTETVYGLGSAPTEPGVRALAALKGREIGKPFLVLVSDRAMASRHGLLLPPPAERLAAAFWPGPLTLVLPGSRGILPDTLRGPEGGIAVRWTSHRASAALAAALGSPITSTSANRVGERPAEDAERIAASFAGAMADGTLVVLDGGRLSPSLASTVVDCTRGTLRLVREGAVPLAELRRVAAELDG